MKIECYSDKIVIYIINKKVDINFEDIRNLLVSIFNNLKDNYNVDINGNYNINIYINNLYGVVVELIKIYSNNDDCNSIKLNISKGKLFLYKVDDPLDYMDNEVYYYDNSYYLNINNIDITLFEHATLIYDDTVYKVLGRGIKL